jgi:hypothetical protein
MPEFRREVQHPSALNLLDFSFLGAAFASSKCSGGGEEGKIRSFLGEPEGPKTLHFASESTLAKTVLLYVNQLAHADVKAAARIAFS